MSTGKTSRFDRAVAVRPLGGGRYSAEVDTHYNGPVAPNGGVLAAMMLAAATAELGEWAPPARTISAHYLEAPEGGAVEITVEVLRAGKRVAVCDARLHQAGRLACQATIVFSAPRPDAVPLRAARPEAPPPAEIGPAEVLAASPPVFSELEVRPVMGAELFSGAKEAVVAAWMSLRDDDAPLDPPRLVAFSDLLWPAVFPMLEAIAAVPTLQLTVHLRTVAQVASPPVLGRFQTRTIAEGHLEEIGELWSADGELLAQSTQLALILPVDR